MEDGEPARGLWASIRDFNAAYLILAFGLVTIALAVYFLRYRSLKLSDILLSSDRFQALAATAAFTLIALAALASLWDLFSLQEHGSRFYMLLSSVKRLPFAYLVFAVSLTVFIAGFYFLWNQNATIADTLKSPSIDSL